MIADPPRVPDPSLPRLRRGDPAEAGLDADRLRAAAALIERGVAGGVFPGAVALVARAGVCGWLAAFGEAQIAPARRAMAPDTIFDLASLTKVVATLPVALGLVERDRLQLDAPVRAVLPEFDGADRRRVTFRHLLVHTSGLPAWRALYLRARDRAGVLRQICETPLQTAPGDAVEYSDLGILLLGFALERLTGRGIDALVQEFVTGPLALQRTMFAPPAPLWAQCAATEVGHAYERNMAGEDGAAFPWRETVLCGEVHDGNAHYALDGVAPHAGLFSTAWEVATVALQWLRPGALLLESTVEEATADQRQGAAGPPRGLGWVLHHREAFFEPLSARAFGHTGFTGTSLAIDPDEDLIVVLLTNCVHLGGDNVRIQEFRPQFHRAVREALRG